VAADRLVLGVDLGSTKVSLSLWSAAGERVAVERFETPRRPAGEALGEIIARARELGGGSALRAIGVSAGGPTDHERGVILSIPNLPGWEQVPIAAVLGEAFAVPVGVENDANACAVAEWRRGAGRGARSLVFLTFSTGIGAGLVLDGRLHRGSRDLAGEIGHITVEPGGAPCGCGRRGCLEAYASGAGIRRRLDELRRGDPALPADARELVDRAHRGDAFSRRFLEEVASWLARGLAPVVFTLAPDRILLGTIAVGAGDLLLGPLRRELAARVWPALAEGLEVLAAGLGADLGDHAALAAAPDGVV
jgi:glucokinase